MTIATWHDTAASVDRANERWANAVRTYRSSLDLYHRAVALRAATREAPVRNGYAPALPDPPAPSQPDRTVSSPELAELTPREREVARLIARGDTNHQIAESLVLTRGTVANHVAHILYKLGVTNRTQVAALVHHRSVDRD